jgi:4-hydroxy-2-oxoheptanedioate aldolase
MAKDNSFKRAIQSGRRQIGIWSNLSSTLSVEIVAGAGFHWVVLDAEHGPSELNEILSQLQAISSYPVEPVVRIPANEKIVIKKFMDIGVRTFLVPFVETVEEARNVVAYTRYPPNGVRGVSTANRANAFGRVKDYLKTAHERVCILAQIESRQGLDQLSNILSVDGIDAAFIGPSDLAASLGHLGNNGHPDVQAAIASALKTCQKHGKPIGILTTVEADARRDFEAGFAFVAVGSDMGLLARGSEALRDKFRDVVPE